MSTLALAQTRSDILASLRRLGGRATLGDVVADSGLSSDAVRDGLKQLLASHRGHLAVADSGELIYEFDPRLIQRDAEPLLTRMSRAFGRVVRGGFKAWIVVMLVGYFVVFVALVIAAILASQRGGDSRGGWRGGRGRGGLPIDPIFLYWIWGPRWRIGRPYYGHRWERTLPKEDRVPFYKKVFAFVFGPDRPSPDERQLDRSKLRLIRAGSGVVTTAELVEHTGATFDEAEEDMARLLGKYDGEPVVSPDGELVYAFPDVMASVRDDRSARKPNPAWLRLEPPLEVTGNSAGTNAVVAGMNLFTLIASATAPWFIFPRLGLSGPAAFFGLVVVPLVYSVLFFATPAVRAVGVRVQNGRRRRRNVRRVLLGLVFDRSLAGEEVSVRGAIEFVRSKLGETAPRDDSVVRTTLAALAAELDADVVEDDDGDVRYRFTAIADQFSASDVMRRSLRLADRKLGDVVFSTRDDADEAVTRDLELFDRALLGGEATPGAGRPAVDRVAYEDEFALVASDDELRDLSSRRPSRRG